MLHVSSGENPAESVKAQTKLKAIKLQVGDISARIRRHFQRRFR